MSIWEKLRPSFWNRGETDPSTIRHLFNYRRIWKLAVLLTGGVSLIPLIFITIVDYQVTQHAMESEFLLRTTRIVSNTRRTISFFLAERKSALDFIVHDNSYEALNNQDRLSVVLKNLQKSFGGGFLDIGIIDASGYQKNYVGPYSLEGKDYSGQEWYKQVIEHGVHISDVFLGYRQVPHIVIAVKKDLPNGYSYVLRSALGIAPFEDLLSPLQLSGMGDAFMINHDGILQTPSKYHGKILEKLPLPVPQYSSKTRVYHSRSSDGKELVIGYRFIDDSPFIMMIVINKHELMKPWSKTRLELVLFLILSITIILTVIFGTATYMVKKIQMADEKRVMSLHQVEYSNKMASIGRLAASVAHEINNPLAIINEKAGLMKDLLSLRGNYAADQRFLNLIDSILSSVKRAGTITKRLLTFARRFEPSIESIDLKAVIEEVIGFLGKEFEHRSIMVTLDLPEEIPRFESDRGKLQQIFLNIINNAFAAVSNGGHIDIKARLEGKDSVSITFSDDGCGIPKEDLDRVFEPFFSTKTGQGGTGLGLSITYNLTQEIGGIIHVESELGKGTSFKITLPLGKSA